MFFATEILVRKVYLILTFYNFSTSLKARLSMNFPHTSEITLKESFGTKRIQNFVVENLEGSFSRQIKHFYFFYLHVKLSSQR